MHLRLRLHASENDASFAAVITCESQRSDSRNELKNLHSSDLAELYFVAHDGTILHFSRIQEPTPGWLLLVLGLKLGGVYFPQDVKHEWRKMFLSVSETAISSIMNKESHVFYRKEWICGIAKLILSRFDVHTSEISYAPLKYAVWRCLAWRYLRYF